MVSSQQDVQPAGWQSVAALSPAAAALRWIRVEPLLILRHTSAGNAGHTALKSSYARHSSKKCFRSSTLLLEPVLANTAT
jgi:hypothetical protein